MDWFVTGINYKKAHVGQRQSYALSYSQISESYKKLKASGIEQALIISTCNRTEIFLPLSFADEVKSILKDNIYHSKYEFDLFHMKKGIDAVQYFFRICSGLESQIPGDFEILGQVKKSCKLAKKHEMVSGIWERMINSGLHAAKKARTKTDFFSGASSTSYACIEHLKNVNINFNSAKFLIVGTGKIGRHTLEHLLKYTTPEQITLTNRTPDIALELTEKYKLNLIQYDELDKNIRQFDVIICATNAPDFIIRPNMLNQGKRRFLIDLSVPMNIDPEIRNLNKTSLLNIDQLSNIVNKNIEKRKSEIIKVEEIIDQELNELNNWNTIREGMPLFSELKGELEKLKSEVLSKFNENVHPESKDFLDKYADELFHQLSQKWIKKVRNRAINA